MNKKVPVWIVLLIIWLGLVFTVLFSWAVWHIKSDGPLFKGKTGRAIIFIASFPSLVKESFQQLNKKSIFITPNFYPGIKGFKAENNYVDSNYILLPVYDERRGQFVAKLIRLTDQKVIQEWVPDYKELLKKITGDKKDIDKSGYELGQPLIFPDGSIVFHSFNSLIVKIDNKSKLVWVIGKKFHHSLEYDADGNIWSGSVVKKSKVPFNSFSQFRDDAITKISADGKLLFERSVAEILIENGYRGLLLGVEAYEDDLTHLNDIQPALITTKYWNKGDILVSIRHKSTVFLYRPSTNKILWLKTGPWLNQHDVDFIDSTRIGVFGNDMFRTNKADEVLIDGHNEEYVYDFKTAKITTPYSALFKKAKISSLWGGRSDILPNGSIFVEETQKNRLLIGDTQNIKWQFVSRIDDKSTAALAWTRLITAQEFKKLLFLKTN